jgi:hypothetical protein
MEYALEVRGSKLKNHNSMVKVPQGIMKYGFTWTENGSVATL